MKRPPRLPIGKAADSHGAKKYTERGRQVRCHGASRTGDRNSYPPLIAETVEKRHPYQIQQQIILTRIILAGCRQAV
jgi:hypothetical protein